MPRALVADAGRLGFASSPRPRVALVERMGANPVRLATSSSASRSGPGEGGEVTLDDLDAMVADTSEAIVWSLADALQDGDPATALAVAERLIAQGENVTGMIYALASRIRRSGRADLHEATEALADLEVWCRGGADYGDELALTLALRRAARRSALGALAAEPRRRAARDFLRAPVFLCRAPFWTALSILETSCLCSPAIVSASPDSTALSRRRKWVLTVLVRSRFSVRSRSLRRIRFFCEAMLAISLVPERASSRLRAAADYSD